jgi:hypothetical protein
MRPSPIKSTSSHEPSPSGSPRAESRLMAPSEASARACMLLARGTTASGVAAASVTWSRKVVVSTRQVRTQRSEHDTQEGDTHTIAAPPARESRRHKCSTSTIGRTTEPAGMARWCMLPRQGRTARGTWHQTPCTCTSSITWHRRRQRFRKMGCMRCCQCHLGLAGTRRRTSQTAGQGRTMPSLCRHRARRLTLLLLRLRERLQARARGHQGQDR